MNIATVLFSHEGKYKAYVYAKANSEDDGFHYYVNVTNKEFDSHKKAIRNARAWLKKKRSKYYTKHPRKWVKRKRTIPKEMRNYNPIKTYHKLYKMKKQTAKILVKHSDKKLKLHPEYAKKTWRNKKVSAVSGETTHFTTAIASVMAKGNKIERKLVSKMLVKFVSEPYRKSNLFY